MRTVTFQAQYYVQEHEQLDDVVAEVHAAGLVLSAYQDEHGEEMVRFAASPETRLGDLVSWNELLPFTKLEPELETILQVLSSHAVDPPCIALLVTVRLYWVCTTSGHKLTALLCSISAEDRELLGGRRGTARRIHPTRARYRVRLLAEQRDLALHTPRVVIELALRVPLYFICWTRQSPPQPLFSSFSDSFSHLEPIITRPNRVFLAFTSRPLPLECQLNPYSPDGGVSALELSR